MIVALHWREYTLVETVRLIEKMGFQLTQKYYFVEKERANTTVPLFRKLISLGKTLIKAVVYLIPSFRPFQVVVGKKLSEPTYDFWLTEANS
jgi:hypothetical protein